jgi:hypothetical protein
MGEFDKGGIYAAIYRDAFNFHRKYRGLRADDEKWKGVRREYESLLEPYAKPPGREFAERMLHVALMDIYASVLLSGPGQRG